MLDCGPKIGVWDQAATGQVNGVKGFSSRALGLIKKLLCQGLWTQVMVTVRWSVRTWGWVEELIGS